MMELQDDYNALTVRNCNVRLMCRSFVVVVGYLSLEQLRGMVG